MILLPNLDDEEAEFKEVEIDIKTKAFMNAERYYQEKKKMEVKEKKTLEASHQALKLAERAAMSEITHVIVVSSTPSHSPRKNKKFMH